MSSYPYRAYGVIHGIQSTIQVFAITIYLNRRKGKLFSKESMKIN